VIRVTVDIRQEEKLAEAGSQAMHMAPLDMEYRLNQAAAEERATHLYQNQTGHLENSTKAGTISETADETVIDLEMGEPYASFVHDLGYSRFVELGNVAVARIYEDIEAAERALERL